MWVRLRLRHQPVLRYWQGFGELSPPSRLLRSEEWPWASRVLLFFVLLWKKIRCITQSREAAQADMQEFWLPAFLKHRCNKKKVKEFTINTFPRAQDAFRHPVYSFTRTDLQISQTHKHVYIHHNIPHSLRHRPHRHNDVTVKPWKLILSWINFLVYDGTLNWNCSYGKGHIHA
jgi:hypothetical protein